MIPMPQTSRRRLDWHYIIQEAIEFAHKFKEEQGFPTTLRGIFYYLVSKNLIPNTPNAYKYLSKKLSKGRLEGYIQLDLKDDTRKIYIPPSTETPRTEWLEKLTRDELIRILRNVFGGRLNKWDGQPYRPIIVVEKNTLYSPIQSLVENEKLDVPVVLSRGFQSTTVILRLADMINRINEEGATAIILLISDLDPSGWYIERDYDRRLRKAGAKNFIMRKIMVVEEDIIKYPDIPPEPLDRSEIVKMERDPRYKAYVEHFEPIFSRMSHVHDPKHVRVEVDALMSLKPDYFKQKIINSVMQFFNEQIYKQREAEFKKLDEEFEKKLEEKVRELLGMHNEKKDDESKEREKNSSS